jgi:hypothetical protein
VQRKQYKCKQAAAAASRARAFETHIWLCLLCTSVSTLLLVLQEGKLDDLSKMIDILEDAGFHKTQYFKDQVGLPRLPRTIAVLRTPFQTSKALQACICGAAQRCLSN